MSEKREVLTTEVPERLLVADWDDILPRVQLWANHFHRRYLRQVRAAPSPEDLVQEAIVKLYSGRRKLPDHVPLLTVIINNIQSDIWNFLTKEGYTKKDSQGKGRKGWGRHIGLEEWTHNVDEHSIPPDAELKGLHDTIRIQIEDDKELTTMVDFLFEDPLLKPRDLARLMDLSIQHVNNAQKRLRRKLKSLQTSLNKS
jgi:DNA-directed RNA polymerase specialized sigma24 family protein